MSIDPKINTSHGTQDFPEIDLTNYSVPNPYVGLIYEAFQKNKNDRLDESEQINKRALIQKIRADNKINNGEKIINGGTAFACLPPQRQKAGKRRTNTLDKPKQKNIKNLDPNKLRADQIVHKESVRSPIALYNHLEAQNSFRNIDLPKDNPTELKVGEMIHDGRGIYSDPPRPRKKQSQSLYFQPESTVTVSDSSVGITDFSEINLARWNSATESHSLSDLAMSDASTIENNLEFYSSQQNEQIDIEGFESFDSWILRNYGQVSSETIASEFRNAPAPINLDSDHPLFNVDSDEFNMFTIEDFPILSVDTDPQFNAYVELSHKPLNAASSSVPTKKSMNDRVINDGRAIACAPPRKKQKKQ